MGVNEVDPPAEPVGPWTLHERLGRGGMGEVWRASNEVGGEVALKLIRDDLLDQPEVRRRFTREARAAARLEHPHITRLLDFGTADQRTYMAMELVRGGSLADWRHHPPDGDTVMKVIDEVLDALGYAHARGVVHRDLKPDNILLSVDDTGQPSARVLDFGVAWFRDQQVFSEADHALVGTPAYMSPEQALKASDVSPAADLYAVGVILFELLTGTLPFEGRSPAGTLYAHIRNAIPPVVPRPGYKLIGPVQDVIHKLLAKNPADRYLFAIDVRQALSGCRIGGSGGHTGDFPIIPEQAAVTRMEAVTPAAGSEPTVVDAAPAGAAFSLFHFREPPLRGRDDEWHELLSLAQRSRSDFRPRVVVVSGEMGVGKSRLVERLREVVEERGWMQAWTGWCEPGAGAADDGLRQALRKGIGVGPLTLAEADLRVDEWLKRHGDESTFEREALLEVLRPEVISEDRPRVLAQEEARFALVERVLSRASSTRPLLLTIEDVQNSDGSVVRLIRWLLDVASRLPALIVLTARPEALERGTVGRALSELFARKDDRVRHLEVPRLDLRSMHELVRATVPMEPVVADAVAMRAGGSPLIAVELVRHLVESGRLEGFGDAPTPEDVLSGLPDGVGGLLRRRLDEAARACGATDVTRDVWERLAVLGARFDVPLALQTLSPLGRDAALALDAALTAGVSAGLLVDDDVPGTFRFDNPMLREALLDRVAEQGRRRELHLVAAEAREHRWADDLDAHALEIARHLHAAGLQRRALDGYRRYAAWARSAGEVLAAVDAWRGAEAMVADGPREAAIEVALGRADAHLALAEYDEARELARRAERIAETTPPAEATRILATVANRAGETRRAHALYAESIERFAARGDAGGQAHAELGLADLELRNGRPPEAERLLRAALGRLREVGDTRAAAEATAMLGRAALDTGLHDEALDYVTAAIADWDAAGDRLGSARGRLLAGEIALAQRQTEAAREAFDEARDALLALGDRHSAAVAGFLSGLAAEAAGDERQARRLLDDAVHQFEWIGDQQYAAVARLALGRLDAESGAWDRADSAIRRVVDRDETERIDDPRFVALLIETGRLAIFAGRDDVARRLLKTAAFKLGRIAEGTGLYDRVDEVQYLLHELENDSGLDGGTALADLVSDD